VAKALAARHDEGALWARNRNYLRSVVGLPPATQVRRTMLASKAVWGDVVENPLAYEGRQAAGINRDNGSLPPGFITHGNGPTS